MFSEKDQNKSKNMLVLSLVLLFLFTSVPMALADGEEPIIGVIERIANGLILLEVTEDNDAGRLQGEKLTISLNNDTRIENESLDIVPLTTLFPGYSVYIKPNTLSNGRVEAQIVQIRRRTR